MNKKTPYLRVIVGSVGSHLKMYTSDAINRLNDPRKYYKNNRDIKNFLQSVHQAEETLEKMCENRKNSIVFEKDSDYVFDFSKSYNGVYVCYYKLIEVEPS